MMVSVTVAAEMINNVI